MATPYHNHDFRPDNKIFRIWCPQSPLVRTQMYDNIDCDEHPIGTNAVVAVITFTGYDMEACYTFPERRKNRATCGEPFKTLAPNVGPGPGECGLTLFGCCGGSVHFKQRDVSSRKPQLPEANTPWARKPVRCRFLSCIFQNST